MTDTVTAHPDFSVPPPPVATKRTGLGIQWNSNAEARISLEDMDAVSEAVDDCTDGNYRRLFPVHGPWGALSLGIEGHTLWLYAPGGAFNVAELVDPATVRPRGVPTSGIVDISRLTPDVQAAIATIMKASQKR